MRKKITEAAFRRLQGRQGSSSAVDALEERAKRKSARKTAGLEESRHDPSGRP